MNRIICGDSLEKLRDIEAGSVQTCVTSPPYYGLRDYGVTGQIGLEATPDEFIARLVDVFAEVRRVLRDDGTLWVNMGDSYASPQKGTGGINGSQLSNSGSLFGARKVGMGDAKEKDLLGIPWMLAFALRADGWYLRSDIIWAKPNPMPESVTDRPTKSHEHIFLLSKQAQYFYDADAIKEPANYPNDDRKGRAKETNKYKPDGFINGLRPGNYTHDLSFRNKRDVWTVSTKPYSGAHFATFPRDLIVPCILAGTSEKGQCPKCGAAWERVTERTNESNWEFRKTKGAVGGSKDDGNKQQIGSGWSHDLPANETVTTGWQPTCNCGETYTVPQIVLDPFGGAGTTAKTAQELGREYITIELNPKYVTDIITPRLLATNVPLAGML